MTNPFKNISIKREHIDRPFWIIFLFLVAVSILALFSASSTLINKATAQGHNPLQPIALQIVYLGLGVGIAYLIQFLPTWVYRLFGYGLLATGLLFLLLNACHIGFAANGAYRWVKIGGITIQSSELAKLGLIIVVSDLFSRIHDEESLRRYFRLVLCITAVTCVLIMIGNLSTAVLLGGVILIMMILAKIPWKWWSSIIVVATVVLVAGFFFVKLVYVDREKKMEGPLSRAVTWVRRIENKAAEDSGGNGTYRVTSDNLQAMMARVAVARGGQSPLGVGPGNSLQRNYLPLANADYIFAIIVEETGIIGAIGLAILYLAILFRCCLTSSRYSDYSAQLMVMGLGIMITLQALISMAVAVGLGPVTGQPLPMISKGGTSAIITSIYFGIMMGVAREQHKKQAEELQVIEESRQDIPEIEVD